MPQRKFEPTEGLLHDVMTKQAGSLEKAVLEAVMNSIDAGATAVEVWLEEDFLQVNDNGDGMSKEEVITYYQKFGLKGDDIEDKEFGKFRMGRGQIFNFGKNIWHSEDNLMIVDLQNDETWVHEDLHNGPKTVEGEETAEVLREEDQVVENISGGETESKVTVLDSSGLSYNLLQHINSTEGCTIDVHLYNNVDDVDSKVADINKLVRFLSWVHDVEIVVNDEKVDYEPDPDHETENAWFDFEPDESISHLRNYSSQTAIYNKGAFVKDQSLSNTKSIIITKTDLDINLARNDILETDVTWGKIKDEYTKSLVEYLTTKNTSDISDSEGKWLLSEAAEDKEIYSIVRELPLITDIEDNKLSITDLSNEKITFAQRNDSLAESLNSDSETVFIQQQYRQYITQLLNETNVVDYKEAAQEKSKFEMSDLDDDSLSKKRRQNLQRARWFMEHLGYRGYVVGGYSRHADFWKDDDDTVYIHKGVLNSKKQKFIVVHLESVLREASFTGSTMQPTEENYNFKNQYAKLSKGKAELQNKLLNGEADIKHY